MVSKKDLYDYTQWRQRIEIEEGEVTPGTHSLEWDTIGLPEVMDNKTFLEIGSYDGMYSFEAERRGAEKVLATDIWESNELEGSEYSNTPNKRGFNLMHEYLDSSVESENIDISNISPSKIGEFDITLCMSVLSWTNFPLWSLGRLASVTNESLILTISLNKVDSRIPKMKMFGDPNGSEYQQRWLMNKAALEYILTNILGFTEIKIQRKETSAKESKYVKLKSPITLYDDYNLTSKKLELDSGTYVKIRGEVKDKVCIGDWPYIPDVSNKVGWASLDNLNTTNQGAKSSDLTTVHGNDLYQYYKEEGLRTIVKEAKDYIFNIISSDKQQSYIVHAIR